MASSEQPPAGKTPQIGKQIVLPWSKAIEISFKGMQTRFWRSLITMSSIVLAIAFLMSIWTSSAIINGLKTVPREQSEAATARAARVQDFLGRAKAGDAEAVRLVAAEAPDLIPSVESDLAKARAQLKATEKSIRQEADEEMKKTTLKSQTAERRAVLMAVRTLVRVVKPENLKQTIEKVDMEWPTDKIEEVAAAELKKTVPPGPPGQLIAQILAESTAELKKPIQKLEQQLAVLTKAKGGDTSDPVELADTVSLVALASERRLNSRAEEIQLLLYGQGVAAEKSGQPVRRGVFGFISQMDAKDLWLVTLALLVCFVGIVNAMLMSVSERFREIGTMKCLGALDSFIVKLFLLESSFQGLAGTAIGIVIGFIVSFVYGLSRFTARNVIQYFPGADLLVSVGLSLIAGVVLSVLAAVYPARTAARMQPVEAMRVEE